MISRRGRSNLKKFSLILAVVTLFFLIFIGYKSFRFLNNIGVVLNRKVASKPKTTYTTALLGYGGGIHAGAYLTDSIVIAHLDYLTKKALLISIPRDLWVKLPTKSKDPFAAKINTVYQLQLFPQTFPDVAVKQFTKSDKNGLIKKVLKGVTGLTIDSVVAVDFEAFKTIINELNGIDLYIDKGFTDLEYPIEGKENDLCGKEEKDLAELEKIATESMVLAFPCRYEAVIFKAGQTHLSAEQALKYARSRHSEEDGGDFARAARQQKMIEATVDKLLSPIYLSKVPTLMDKLESQVQTDVSYNDLTVLLKQAPKADQYKLEKLILSDNNFLTNTYSEDGQYILIPKKGFFKWKQIHNNIKKLTAKPTVTPVSPSKE